MEKTVIFLILSIVIYKLILLDSTSAAKKHHVKKNVSVEKTISEGNLSENELFKGILRDLTTIGNVTIDLLHSKRHLVDEAIQAPYIERIKHLKLEMQNTNNAFQAQSIRIRLYNIAKSFLSKVENINSSVSNVREQLELFKMHCYKENSDATVKIHNSITSLPWSNLSIYIQYLYKNPSSPSFRKHKQEYFLNQDPSKMEYAL